MTALEDPARLEEIYGALGTGSQTVTLRGVTYPVSELLSLMDLNFDDSRAIDAIALPDGRWLFRYYDGQDQRVVALELDAGFRCLGEVRAKLPGWGDEDDSWGGYCGH